MLKSPLFRLLSVTIAVLAAAMVLLSLIRWMGAQETYMAPPHPWMTRGPWLIARLAPEDCSQMALEQLLELDESWLIWVDVQSNPTQGFDVVCPLNEIFETRSETKRGPHLEHVLPLLKKRGVILNVRSSNPSIETPFLKTLDEWDDKKTDIGIAGVSQSVLRDLRKQRPQWLFASDASTWTKLKFFAMFGIPSVVEVWPDFFVASLNPDDPNFYDAATAKEISRRKKVMVLNIGDADPNAIRTSIKENVRGILTTRPKNFQPDTFFKKTGAE